MTYEEEGKFDVIRLHLFFDFSAFTFILIKCSTFMILALSICKNHSLLTYRDILCGIIYEDFV